MFKLTLALPHTFGRSLPLIFWEDAEPTEELAGDDFTFARNAELAGGYHCLGGGIPLTDFPPDPASKNERLVKARATTKVRPILKEETSSFSWFCLFQLYQLVRKDGRHGSAPLLGLLHPMVIWESGHGACLPFSPFRVEVLLIRFRKVLYSPMCDKSTDPFLQLG